MSAQIPGYWATREYLYSYLIFYPLQTIRISLIGARPNNITIARYYLRDLPVLDAERVIMPQPK